MSADRRDPGSWPRSRWYLFIALVFAGQIGLIFAVGDRKPFHPRQPEFVPELRLPAQADELLSLTDPTLLALPSKNGFSAAAWLETPPTPHDAFEWSEPDRWLPLPAGELGGVLTAFMQTNRLRIANEISRPREPLLTYYPPPPSPPPQTRMRVDGDLAQRRLLASPRLPVLQYTDVLQDSAVQVYVNEAGEVMTTALLPPGSGSDQADQQALRFARAVRFAPLNDTGDDAHWTRGSLVFQWATMPVSTNAPAPAP